ncbi:MAG TPA: ATP-binding cassette domain-containing protein [Puia sp.]|nr:ATP-binding cassette domain-containing protein [Puia sp.]
MYQIFKKVLRNKGKWVLVSVALLTLSNTLFNYFFLFFISNMISKRPIPFLAGYDWLAFTVMLITTLLINKASQGRLIRISYNVLFEFEQIILQKFRMASYNDFERLGKEKLYTALNDARLLSNMPSTLVSNFNALIMILCCIIFFLWIYFYAACILLIVMIGILILYLKRDKIITGKLKEVRLVQDKFYEIVDDLLHGFKEVKMSTVRSRNLYFKHLLDIKTRGNKLGIRAENDYLNNEMAGRFSWFAIIGIVIYLFPLLFTVNDTQTVTFMVAILYLIGPVQLILASMPYYGGVKVAMGRLNEFNELLQPLKEENTQENIPYHQEAFESLWFEDVYYEHTDGRLQKNFVLGPVNLKIDKGEVIFIIGGNGSGKSTFFNILTGLYRPVRGNIYFNGRKLEKEEFPHYRNQMAALFSNSHLFSRNYDDFLLEDSNTEMWKWVHCLDMQEVFDLANTSLHKQISKGQQKRLAMIYAMLENKEIMAMDEWAAEQDPHMREFFYTSFLQQLRELQKTVIIITHDDRYFNQADRIIKFDYGKIVKDFSAARVE